MTDQPFWKTKRLQDMSPSEWESLCDGCAKCCLNKLIDEDTDQLYFTDVACRLLNRQTCRCRNYPERTSIVPECQVLKPENISEFAWLPSTCAYRLIAEGKDLYDWHPLITGDPNSVHDAGMSVRGRCKSESDIWDWENHIVTWPA